MKQKSDKQKPGKSAKGDDSGKQLEIIGELKYENALLKSRLQQLLDERLEAAQGTKIASSEYSLIGVKKEEDLEAVAGVNKPEEVTIQVRGSLAEKIRKAKQKGLIVCMTDTIKAE